MVTINLKRYEATCKGEVIPLSIGELRTLLALANNVPNTKQELSDFLSRQCDYVYDYKAIPEIVSRLRQKLIEARAFDIDIVCRFRIGYQLYGDIYIDY